VAESSRLTDLVQAAIDGYVDRQSRALLDIARDLDAVLSAARDLLQGGKRFRARFCYWGWRAIAGLPDPLDPMAVTGRTADRDAVIAVAAALELLHAAALVHDDIIDRSATRRGAPAAHERFAALHRAEGWARDDERFGQAAALLLGDLLLGWADALFDEGASALRSRADGDRAKAEFAKMRAEVILGQYLDVLEEHSWIARPDAEAAMRAQRVVVYKSAKYSVEAPLVIGALLGGASAEQISALRGYGLPLGIAFQLRDDILGVFGDPDVTGKPAGDDLREGKRTVLIAMARSALPGPSRSLLDELLGDPDLTDEQVGMLSMTIRECGAVAQLERAIDHNVGKAVAALDAAEIGPTAKRELLALAEAVARRSA